MCLASHSNVLGFLFELAWFLVQMHLAAHSNAFGFSFERVLYSTQTRLTQSKHVWTGTRRYADSMSILAIIASAPRVMARRATPSTVEYVREQLWESVALLTQCGVGMRGPLLASTFRFDPLGLHVPCYTVRPLAGRIVVERAQYLPSSRLPLSIVCYHPTVELG